MKSHIKPRIALITSLNNEFIAELIERIKLLPTVSFQDVIYCARETSPLRRVKANLWKNLRKHGLLYVPWRLGRLINDAVLRNLGRFIEGRFLDSKIQRDLYSACSGKGLRIHKVDDLHSTKTIELATSLNLDILAVCGTGILRRTLIDIAKIGTINLHQGKVPEYRGAPPGFWELWNGENEVGVTIHFVDEGTDTGDIILQEMAPIFKYDNLSSVEKKLEEASLSLYPEAINQIACGTNQRIKQSRDIGKQYFMPTLRQRLQLYLGLRKKQFNLLRLSKNVVKNVMFPALIVIASMKDYYLRKRGKRTLTILYYHRVTNICQDGMTVSIDSFERQMRFLKKSYKILSPAELCDWLNTEKTHMAHINEKSVLITFDDGYGDNFTNALPILKKYQCPAIFFVSTGLISNDRQFEHDLNFYPQLRFRKMTWQELQAATESGIHIGIHTDTHKNLSRISFEEARKEIEKSLEKYEARFGQNSVLMSYPFGGEQDITQEVIRYVAGHPRIVGLFSAYGGKNVSPFERYNLKRFNVGSNVKGLMYAFQVSGGLEFLFGKKATDILARRTPFSHRNISSLKG